MFGEAKQAISWQSSFSGRPLDMLWQLLRCGRTDMWDVSPRCWSILQMVAVPKNIRDHLLAADCADLSASNKIIFGRLASRVWLSPRVFHVSCHRAFPTIAVPGDILEHLQWRCAHSVCIVDTRGHTSVFAGLFTIEFPSSYPSKSQTAPKGKEKPQSKSQTPPGGNHKKSNRKWSSVLCLSSLTVNWRIVHFLGNVGFWATHVNQQIHNMMCSFLFARMSSLLSKLPDRGTIVTVLCRAICAKPQCVP